MRRPHSPLVVVALLGACLVLSACARDGSIAASETRSAERTATAAQSRASSRAPGVRITKIGRASCRERV